MTFLQYSLFRLIRLIEPGPPVTFEVTAKGSTHFDLKWRPPLEPNGVLIGYHISYQTS